MPNEATIENLNIEIEGTVSQSNTQAIRDQADALNQLSRSLLDATSNASGYARAMSALQTPDRGASTAPIRYWTDSADNQNQNQSGSLGKSPMDWNAFYQEAQQQAASIQEAMTPDIDSLVSHFRGYDELIVRIDTAREKLTALLTSGKDINDTGVQRLVKQIQKLQDEIGKTGEKAEESGKKAQRGMSGWQKLANSFKRILMYRAIRSVLKSITTIINDGVKNVVLWSDAMGDMDKFGINKTLSGYSTQIEYVKNSLGAALVPLLQSLVPIFIQITDVVVDALNAINQMIRSMQGYSTYLKAEKYDVNFADQWKNATSAAKEYQKVLAGFDELNILQSQKSTESSGMDIKNAFAQETPIDENVVTQTKWIVGIAGSIIAIVESVKLIKGIVDAVKVIKTFIGKLPAIWNGIKTVWGVVWSGIKTAWGGIKTAWSVAKGFFTSGAGGISAAIVLLALAINRYISKDYTNTTSEQDTKYRLKDAAQARGETEKAEEAWNSSQTAKNAFNLAESYKKQKKTLLELESSYDALIKRQTELIAQGQTFGEGGDLDFVAEQLRLVTEEINNSKNLMQDIENSLKESGYGYMLVTNTQREYTEEVNKTVLSLSNLSAATQLQSDYEAKRGEILQRINELTADGHKLSAAESEELKALYADLVNIEYAVDLVTKKTQELADQAGTAKTNFSVLFGQLKELKGQKIPVELAVTMNTTFKTAFDGSYKGGNAAINEKLIDRWFRQHPEELSSLNVVSARANGGFVPRGDLFIANEQGAELVGRIGNQTAVANQTQIVDAVSAGVYRAMREAGGSGGETRIALMVDRKTLTEVVVDTINNTVRQTGASPLLV